MTQTTSILLRREIKSNKLTMWSRLGGGREYIWFKSLQLHSPTLSLPLSLPLARSLFHSRSRSVHMSCSHWVCWSVYFYGFITLLCAVSLLSSPSLHVYPLSVLPPYPFAPSYLPLSLSFHNLSLSNLSLLSVLFLPISLPPSVFCPIRLSPSLFFPILLSLSLSSDQFYSHSLSLILSFVLSISLIFSVSLCPISLSHSLSLLFVLSFSPSESPPPAVLVCVHMCGWQKEWAGAGVENVRTHEALP